MNVLILNPKKELYKGTAHLLSLIGRDGSFQILKNHAPMISLLSKGIIKVYLNEDKKELLEFSIEKGILEVNQNKVTILL